MKNLVFRPAVKRHGDNFDGLAFPSKPCLTHCLLHPFVFNAHIKTSRFGLQAVLGARGKRWCNTGTTAGRAAKTDSSKMKKKKHFLLAKGL